MKLGNRNGAALAAVALLAVFAQPACAQLRLPGVQLPQLPQRTLPQTLGSLEQAPIEQLTQLRALRVRALIRGNRHEIDADRNGAAVVRGVLVAIAPSDAALTQIRAAGFDLVDDRVLPGLDLRMVVLRAPANLGTRAALDKVRKLDPTGAYDYNHIFDAGGESIAGLAAVQPAAPTDAPTHAPENAPRSPVRVGLIDSGIDATHPVFSDASVHMWGCEGHPVPVDHGTAVASLLVGHSLQFAGVLPHGELYAADVYCGRATGGAVDVIVTALAWMIEQRVGVINISLVGPQNLLLGRAVQLALARGYIIVAAVGNDGPAAPPLYPAAYAGVVGVTAVDAHRKVLVEACRGPHVSFAAPGADMEGAAPGGDFHELRGTSFAAPIVAGLLAAKFSAPEPAAASERIDELARDAVDLGAPGRDPVYGFGLVGAAYRVPPDSPRR